MLELALLLLFWTLVGYPLLMALAASVVDPPPRCRGWTRPIPARIAVIVPACNEAGGIADRLRELLDQQLPPVSIVVVCDGSTDRTAAEAEKLGHPCIRVLPPRPRAGKLAALRRGVEALSGEPELVLLTDANASFIEDALQNIADAFADPDLGSLSGGRRVRPDSWGRRLLRNHEHLLLEHESCAGSAIGAAGEALALRTNLLRELIGRVPENTVNEDFALAMLVIAAGWRHRFDREIEAVEPCAESHSQELARRTRISAGRVRALAHTLSLFTNPLRPWILFQILSHKGLRLILPILLLIVMGHAAAALPALAIMALALAAGASLVARRVSRVLPAALRPLAQAGDLLVDAGVLLLGGMLGLLLAWRPVSWPREPR